MSEAVGEATPPARPRVSGYAWYALGVLVLVYIVNFVDRQIISILVGDIQRDLKVSPAQIGFLYGTAFAVFYALFGIPLGRLADSWYRGRLMAMGLALWSSMTALSGFASSFTMLAAARIGVGIGEASASPAAYSMISDSFPKERRATALSIYSSGLYIGGALSLPIGGFVVAKWNAAYPVAAQAPLGLAGWQAAFLAVGLPGLLLALWVLTLREPQRGASDGMPQPVVRPNAWREFGKELVAILPPMTLFNVARNPRGFGTNLGVLALLIGAVFALWRSTGEILSWAGYAVAAYAVFSWGQSLAYRSRNALWANLLVLALVLAAGYGAHLASGGWPHWLLYALSVYAVVSWFQSRRHADFGSLRINVVVLALVVLAGYGLTALTGTAPQWIAYGLGVYAIFSWVQSLKRRDAPTYKLIWGSPGFMLLAIAFGSISFVTYATSFWLPYYVEEHFYGGAAMPARYFTGFTAKAEVGLIIGVTAAISAAIGVILGGYISDLWRQRDPRGRLFIIALSVLLPIPIVAFLLTTNDLAAFYWMNPLAHMLASAWVGAAVATLQDLVLPRMRATAGATYVLGTTMVGLALGPYFAGQVIGMTDHNVALGIAALYFMPALTLLGLWLGARRIGSLEATKVERARAAGEPI